MMRRRRPVTWHSSGDRRVSTPCQSDVLEKLIVLTASWSIFEFQENGDDFLPFEGYPENKHGKKS
jgi:hypothetical protein